VMVPGPDLAVHADLADAAGDQLGVLRAEVEDEDLVGMDVGHGSSVGSGAVAPGGPWPAPASTDLVVRRLLGDGHVVHVALALAGASDGHELRLAAHVLDRAATDITHGRAQAAGKLVDDVGDRAAVRHPALDAFGHQLVGVGG